jgi:hypothetical protein
MSKENKFQLLYEYATMGDGSENNKMMQGETRPAGPKRMTLMDIVGQFNKSKEDDVSAPHILPSPLSNNHLEAIADLYSKSTALQTDIKQAAKNPIIKDNKKLTKAAVNIYKKLNKIKSIVKDIGSDLDDFSIEK